MITVLYVLSLLVCLNSASFLSGRQQLSPQMIRSLLQSKGVQPFFTRQSNDVLRTSARLEQPMCFLLPIERSVALAARFEGPLMQAGYFDSRNEFFRLALGWGETRIEHSRLQALEYFKDAFGLDGSSLKYDSTFGLYGSDKLGFGAYVLNVTFVQTADSDILVPCPNVTAVLGGWVLFGVDITYPKIPFGTGPQTIAGDSSVYVMYLVGQHGTRMVTKIQMKARKPQVCTLNLCPLVAATEVIDDPFDTNTGCLDAIIVEQEVAPGISREFHTFVLTFPGMSC
eukprot:gb/GEZJ01004613.1/.p1 GENE.gb/GEZJ01004613.1/~~gb/GEZJ01004613.1/.p1  ORF type:complete len:284 (-),score=19.34 gb/GEZJ01004613.1/:608-1459(-)